MRTIWLLLLCIISGSAWAQSPVRKCASHDKLLQQLATDPAFALRRSKIEAFTRAAGEQPILNQLRGTPTYTIPVVFHIVYRTATENISEAQIMSQLKILNDDFQKLNADTGLVPTAFRSVYADCKIQFCLAKKDPSGAAATGILRKSTSVTSFSTDDKMKNSATGGSSPWDPTRYLNIWVCNLGGGLLGYAQFPGGPTATDGVVIGYTATGNTGTAAAPYNKGRTATHEVGHYLNLYHIWGDDGSACTGSDQVGDTPNQGADNFGCPAFPKISCSNGPNGDMFMNYMDYTDDACMMMFTNGQRTRMYGVLQAGGARAALGSNGPCDAAVTCTRPVAPTADSIGTSTAVLRWINVANTTNQTIYYRPAGGSWTALRSLTGTSVRITGLAPGTAYQTQLTRTCSSSGTLDTSLYGSFSTLSGTVVCTPPASQSASSVTSSTARLSWRKSNGALSYVLQYRRSAVTTFTIVRNISDTQFQLTGLSASTAYQFQVRSTCSSRDSSSLSALTSFTTAAVTPACTDLLEPNNSLSTSKNIQVNTDLRGQISSATDQDYYTFSTTSASRNIKITLSELPGDYDVRLLNSGGKLLKFSERADTLSESIVLNGGAAGSYRVQVYGYNGANSSSRCYKLRVTTSSATLARQAEEQILYSSKAGQQVLQVSPQPASGTVYLNTKALNGRFELRVINSMGVPVMQRTLYMQGSPVPVEVSSLKEGMYFLQLVNSEHQLNGRLLIKK